MKIPENEKLDLLRFIADSHIEGFNENGLSKTSADLVRWAVTEIERLQNLLVARMDKIYILEAELRRLVRLTAELKPEGVSLLDSEQKREMEIAQAYEAGYQAAKGEIN